MCDFRAAPASCSGLGMARGPLWLPGIGNTAASLPRSPCRKCKATEFRRMTELDLISRILEWLMDHGGCQLQEIKVHLYLALPVHNYRTGFN